ncbi:MAG: hypothetical protein PVI90_07195 [Desulfobacteraceae bacterium]|jgi:nickel transport protein
MFSDKVLVTRKEMRRLTFTIVFLLGLLIWVPLTFAHNVTIFAWVEGDTVYTESKFSGGRVAKDAPIEVYDKAGTKLLTGKTDEKGEYSFKLPKKEELRIVLMAGMGHGNEWTLTAEDIAEAEGDPSAESVNQTSTPPTETPTTPADTPAESTTKISSPELEAALEKMLDKKLAPILKKLSRLEAKEKEGPGVTEIIGGIGYILGLMGLAAYIQFKRSTKDSSK